MPPLPSQNPCVPAASGQGRPARFSAGSFSSPPPFVGHLSQLLGGVACRVAALQEFPASILRPARSCPERDLRQPCQRVGPCHVAETGSCRYQGRDKCESCFSQDSNRRDGSGEPPWP